MGNTYVVLYSMIVIKKFLKSENDINYMFYLAQYRISKIISLYHEINCLFTAAMRE